MSVMTQAELRNQFLTAAEYLNYDDGTDAGYELCNGRLMEMPPESHLNQD
jgi:Uma2 family endonuclease